MTANPGREGICEIRWFFGADSHQAHLARQQIDRLNDELCRYCNEMDTLEKRYKDLCANRANTITEKNRRLFGLLISPP